MEPRRIAVIGCSNTAYDQAKMYDTTNRDWVDLFSEARPDIEWHNYALPAHGALYFDWVLKNILANQPRDYYDTLIVQHTILGRWFTPITSAWLDPSARSDMFSPRQISPNYTVMCMNAARLVSTRAGTHAYGNRDHATCKHMESVMRAAHEPDGMLSLYELNFTKLCASIYGSHFSRYFCWDWACNAGFGREGRDNNFADRNNIGHELPFQSWSIQRYGTEYHVLNLIDDSFHCTKLGNEVLAFEYLADSRLGEYLKIKPQHHDRITS